MITSFTFFVSIAGIIYSITLAIYTVSYTQIQSMDSIFQHDFDVFCVWLNTGLTIIGWLLFLMASGATTPVVAALFILAEAVYIIQALNNLILIFGYNLQNMSHILNNQHNEPRYFIALEAYEKKTWVHLLSAVLMTVIITGWCIAPESLVVGGLSFLAMGILYWKKHLEIVRIDAEMLTAVEITNKSNNSVSLANSHLGLFSRNSHHSIKRKDEVLLEQPDVLQYRRRFS